MTPEFNVTYDGNLINLIERAQMIAQNPRTFMLCMDDW